MASWVKHDPFLLPTGYGTEWRRKWYSGAEGRISALSMGRSNLTGRVMRSKGIYREYVWSIHVPWRLGAYDSGTTKSLAAAKREAESAHRQWLHGVEGDYD